MRVISGHLGWVRSVAVEPGNKWFVSGAGDRVIKVWDLASGELKLSLTGHISTVRGLAVSPRHPYLFSCGEDKVCNIIMLSSQSDFRSRLKDGKMLGPGGEQSDSTLSWASVWCLLSQPTSDTRRSGDCWTRRVCPSLGYEDQGASARSNRTHGYRCGR